MRDDKNIHPILFLDDWPLPPNSDGRTCAGDEDYMGPGLNQMRKWRIQTLLAVNPWGIPVMAFKSAYERMFCGKIFEPKDHGYENIGAMVYDLPEIFAIQEPDDVTALMFPDYPHDRVLHDARLGHEFASATAGQDHDDELGHQPPGHDSNLLRSAIESQQQIARRWNSSTIDGQIDRRFDGGKTIDPDILISYAWIHRDTEFPPDVVLAGEHYTDLMLPLTSANIPGTRGVHQAIIVGVANPGNFYVNVKSADTQRAEILTSQIYQFFMQCGANIDSYSVPDEFIYPGFPCLVYSRDFKCWERCIIVSRSRRTNRVLVEYVDFGGTITVNRIYLYLMPRKFLDLPKQAILCSLIGVQPKNGPHDKWSRTISCRMRFFSQPRYWLDMLLMEPKADRNSSAAAVEDKSTAVASHAQSAEPASSATSAGEPTIGAQASGEHSELQDGKRKRKKRILQRKPDFEAIVCDRHDEFGRMDIFLNDILVLETYGSRDTNRAVEYNSLKASFKDALASIERPVNPFLGGEKKFWSETCEPGTGPPPQILQVVYDDDDDDDEEDEQNS